MYIIVEYLLLENFIINYLILRLTKLLNRVDIKNKRLLFGAMISSLYSLVFFYPKLEVFTKGFWKVIFSMIIIRISFKKVGIKQFFRLLMSFYIGSFIFAGATLGVFFLKINKYNSINYYIEKLNKFPVINLIIGISFSFIMAIIIFKYLNFRKLKDNYIADIDIYYKDKILSLKALLDTGNSLVDPITQNKVIIVEYEKLKELLPREIHEPLYFLEYSNFNDMENTLLEINNYIKLIPIPFKSIGKSGIIFGFKSDKICIKYMNSNIIRQDILIGIYKDKFNESLGYNGLLNYEIIDGGMKNEVFQVQS